MEREKKFSEGEIFQNFDKWGDHPRPTTRETLSKNSGSYKKRSKMKSNIITTQKFK